jgi:hypothetical protein
VSRRVSLPTADELFRPTAPAPTDGPPGTPDGTSSGRVRGPGAEQRSAGAGKRPSGRVRHDEKMTVYVTSDELLDLEHARLLLRRSHGLAVDRGRIVREALAMVLADLESNGARSALVRRLTEE